MALTTNTQSITAGVCNIASGKVVTDSGTAADTTFDIGFIPRYVNWENATDRIKDEKYEGMAATDTIHTVAAGTRTLDTNSLVTFVGSAASDTARGFKVKTTSIPASKTFYWTAIG